MATRPRTRPVHMTAASALAVTAALFATSQAPAAEPPSIPVVRSDGSLVVAVEAARSRATVVLVRTGEDVAAAMDTDDALGALLDALADEGAEVAAFGHGSLEVRVATSTTRPFALAAFSWDGAEIELLGTANSVPRPKITARQVPVLTREGMKMRAVEYVADEIIVKAAPDALTTGGDRQCMMSRVGFGSAAARRAIVNDMGGQALRRIGSSDMYVVKGVRVDPHDFCTTMAKTAGIEFAEPNYIVRLDGGSAQMTMPAGAPVQDYGISVNSPLDDPLMDLCWGMHNTGAANGVADVDIDAPGAWRIEVGDPSVVVAVIDTGVDYTHPDLHTQMWENPGEIPGNGLDDDGNGFVDDVHGYDFFNLDGDPMDDHSHGTHTSGTVAAAANGVGVAGVAPGVRIMAIKAFSAGGSGFVADIVDAITYAVDNGARVTSNSWGSGIPSDAIEAAFETALASDIVSVASAGNSRSLDPGYPAGFDTVVAVAAADKVGDSASFTNYGPWVDVAAPGVSVLSSVPYSIHPEGYRHFSGTSMACPHVAGIAALVRSAHPAVSARAVMTAIKATADPAVLDSQHLIGTGMANARNALRRGGFPMLEARLDAASFEITLGGSPLLGTAGGPDFDHYVVEVGSLLYSSTWFEVASGTVEVTNGELAVVDATMLPINGAGSIRLRVLDADGNDAVAMIGPINIDNVRFVDPVSYDVRRAGETIELNGSTIAPDFQSYAIEWRSWHIDPGSGYQITTPWTSDGITLANGGAQSVYEGLLATFDTSFVTDPNCTIRMTVVGDQDYLETIEIYLDPTLRSGWPVRVPHAHEDDHELNVMEPVIEDLDNDGVLEVYSFQGGVLHAFDAAGAMRPGFPLDLTIAHPIDFGVAQTRVYTNSAITIANVDADSDLEILVGAVEADTIQIFAIDPHGAITPGFPLEFAAAGAVVRPYSSIVVDDLDADGVDELVFQAFDALVISELDGTQLTDETLDLRPAGTVDTCARVVLLPTYLDATPAVGNLDADPQLEIVVQHETPSCGGLVMALDHDGTLLWERFTQYAPGGSSPVIGDLDGDGDNEIVVTAGTSYGRGGVHAFDHTGALLLGWPFREQSDSFLATPALGDLDGDGDLEIVASPKDGSYIYMLEHDGTPTPAYATYGFTTRYAVGLTDVDQNGVPDVTASRNPFPNSTYSSLIRGAMAWPTNGTVLPGFPKVTESHALAPIQIVDLDGDGVLEAIGSSMKDVGEGYFNVDDAKHRGSIYVWELPYQDAGAAQQWPVFHGNLRRTGRHGDGP